MDRKLALGALCIAALTASGLAAAPRNVERKFDALHHVSSASGESEITPERLKAHEQWLASDENHGRKTGGGFLENRVGPYIEAEMKACGLTPKGDSAGTTYRQPFYARSGWGSPEAHAKSGPRDRAHWGVRANEHGLAFDANGKPVTTESLSPAQLSLLEQTPAAAANTYNLVGFIEGSDPVKKNEIVVFGAHMDHIGERSWGSGDRIFNGADDNGSGTTALLSICRALAKERELGTGPARSIVICFFSGEELGLLGSQFYAENPTVEFSRIKAMLNIDMIARGQTGHVSVCDISQGGGQNAFHQMHDTAGTQLDTLNHDIDEYMERSDQASFYKKGVPVIFFFEGFEANGQLNPDYHGVGDHVDKLDFQKLQDITKFAYRHLLGIANQ